MSVTIFPKFSRGDSAADVRDAIGVYSTTEVDNLLSALGALTSEDIDTLVEINAILTDANLASIAYVDGLAANYATAAQGALADTALQSSDITSGTITAGTGNIDFGNLGGGLGGSAGATDNAILRADGTGGSTVQASGLEITDANELALGPYASGTSYFVGQSTFGRRAYLRTWEFHAYAEHVGPGGNTQCFWFELNAVRTINANQCLLRLDGKLNGGELLRLDTITSTTTGKLIDARNGGTTKFAVDVDGNITGYRSGASDPTTTDIPAGFAARWKNTTSGEIRDWVNDGGTMKKSAAYT